MKRMALCLLSLLMLGTTMQVLADGKKTTVAITRTSEDEAVEGTIDSGSVLWTNVPDAPAEGSMNISFEVQLPNSSWLIREEQNFTFSTVNGQQDFEFLMPKLPVQDPFWTCRHCVTFTWHALDGEWYSQTKYTNFLLTKAP